MYTDGIILRQLIVAGLTTKGSELTPDELDTNFKLIWQDLGARLSAGALPDYNPVKTYSLGNAVKYDGFSWVYVYATPTAGTDPGSDPDYWTSVNVEYFAHQQNTDTKLAEGAVDEVSAAELRAKLDEYTEQTFTLNRTQITNLHTTPVTLLASVTGKAYLFDSLVTSEVDPDLTNFIFASGEYLEIKNSSSSDPLIANIGDSAVTVATASKFATHTNFSGYQLLQSAVSVSATAAITGGGASASIAITLRFKLINV